LAKGESTFLVEMQEAAFILRTATADSFVVMDEIGRGTSTQDGMSIAYAVMRDLVERGVRTLFATHYHELTMLDTRDVQLSTLQVAETKNGIVFLRKLVNGAAGNSYGLHVAAMAGMPQRVLKSAAVFQKRHFEDYTFSGNDSQLDLFKNPDRIEEQCAPDGARAAEIVAKLLEYDLEQATPVQAMGFLELLQQAARD
jgi:DNA mismatch repair protein MutS